MHILQRLRIRGVTLPLLPIYVNGLHRESGLQDDRSLGILSKLLGRETVIC